MRFTECLIMPLIYVCGPTCALTVCEKNHFNLSWSIDSIQNTLV